MIVPDVSPPMPLAPDNAASLMPRSRLALPLPVVYALAVVASGMALRVLRNPLQGARREDCAIQSFTS